MIKKISLIILCFCFSIILAQNSEKNILFLLPFQIEKSNILQAKMLKSEDDILEFSPFELIGFWEGAKMALNEIEKPDLHLNVFVRDITDDEMKLKNVLNEFNDTKIDLIIGPFFAKLFPIAADLAQKRQIPIVNPFSTRDDFVDTNPFVYKLMPDVTYQPAILHELLISDIKNVNIVLWSGSDSNSMQSIYSNYFTNKNIPFSIVNETAGVGALKKKLSPNLENMVIAFYDNNARVISNLQSLVSQGDTNLLLVAPESWINFSNVDFQLFETLHLHFFSNYFIENNDKSELFMLEYQNLYNAPAKLDRFSFQGYDITNYFIELMLNDFNISSVMYEPLSFVFDFVMYEEGGYLNKKSRLISFSNYELKEVK